MTPDDLDEMHRAVGTRFVVRARRIAAHSMFRDEARLRAYVMGEMTAQFRKETDEMIGLRSPVPEEEALESLAARLRPVLLKKDGVLLSTVIRSVQHFARKTGNDTMREHLELTRTDFLELTSSSGLSAFAVQIQRGAGADVAQLTDLQLADSWLYGDVVHADKDQLRASADFGVDERFRAAVSVYTRVAVYAVQVLDCINELQDGGVAACSENAFTVDVVASVVDGAMQLFKEGTTGSMWVAPVGTPAPPFGPQPAPS